MTQLSLKLRETKEINLSVQSQVPAKKKIAKCIQLYFKTRFLALIILTCFTRYTIEMRYARKITSIPIKCREMIPQTKKIWIQWMILIKEARSSRAKPKILHLLIQSLRCSNSMGRALTLVVWIDPQQTLNINRVASCLQIQPQSREDSFLMLQTIHQSKDTHIMASQVCNITTLPT